MTRDQIRYESDTWKLVLAWIAEGNNKLKQQLTDVLEAIFSTTLLEQAETFHSRFMEEEKKVACLKREIKDLDRKVAPGSSQPDTRYLDQFHSLRNEVQGVKVRFTDLEQDFSIYLSSIS